MIRGIVVCGAFLLLAGCDRGCTRATHGEVTPVIREELATDARTDVPPATTKRPIPPAFQGTHVVASGSTEPAQASRLEVFTVTADGVASRTTLFQGTSLISAVVMSPLGNELAFTVAHETSPSIFGQAIYAMGLHAAAPRLIATCDYECALAGISADGEVWYVDLPSSSLIGNVAHVPLSGAAPSTRWPHSFASCAVGATLSEDGTAMLLGVDDALGWPECIDGGFQGFYVVPVADRARRDLKPKRTACFTTHAAKAINIQISYLTFDGPDRIAFVVNDGWDPPDGGVDPMVPWSCKRDGTDPRRTTELPPFLDRVAINGKDWIVVVTAFPSFDADPLRVIGPIDSITAFAMHRAMP